MSPSPQTVLVTGGSGFLGGWCIVRLLENGYTVKTTLRDLARESEVRAAVGSQVDPGDRLSFSVADLSSDEGWADAVAGCDYVLHVASPFPRSVPDDPDELVIPARDGALRVLGAALDAGVTRVVLTSSVAAVRKPGSGLDGRALTEDDWNDPEDPKVSPYPLSKTIAERAAWDLAAERDATNRLAVVNPGAILGPALTPDHSYSLEIMERLLGGMPGTPRLGFSYVDARDVADLEIAAMSSPAAGGERFIAAPHFHWMSEVAESVRRQLGDEASKVPSRTVPDFVVKGMALVDKGLRPITSDLGKRVNYSDAKARETLGWKPRPADETFADTARSLIREEAA